MSLPYYVDPTYPTKKISIVQKWFRAVMNHPMFQRLKHIGQTACADYLFISHRHSRFEHSLGTCYLAGLVCDNLNINAAVKDKVMFASLCHDLGHGPFSHSLEYFTLPKLGIHDFCHEDFSVDIANKIYEEIEEPGFEIGDLGEILNNGGRNLDNEIFNLVSNKSFGVDVDRADYLMRDSYLLGIDLNLQLEKLFKGLVLETDINGKSKVLGIKAEIVRLFHHFIEMRYLMFENMYCQPIATGRNLLVARLLYEADSHIGLSKRLKALDSFVQLDDHILQDALKQRHINDKLDRTIKLVEYNDAYRFVVEFELKDDQMQSKNPKLMSEYSNKLKDIIFGSDCKYKEDVEIYFARIDSFKDVDYPNITVRDGDKIMKLPDYLINAKIEPLKQRIFERFRIFVLSDDMIDEVIEKFKAYEETHKNLVVNVNYDPMIYDIYRALDVK